MDSIQLTNVNIMRLREIIFGFQCIFGREPHIEVSGTFRDNQDQLLVLSKDFYQMDAHVTGIYLTIVVKGEFVKVIPINETIAQVHLS